MDLVKKVFGGTTWYGPVRNFQHFIEAVYAVVSNGYPARDLTVIGVTGTDGKTTTAHIIWSIIQESGVPTALISSVAAYIGNEEIDTGFHVTTPDPGQLQPLLVRIKKKGITHVVLEATSHGLDQHRLLGCNFKIGVLTNITHEHLDYHKTFEHYRDAKVKLFRGVKTAVLNRDDDSFSYIKSKTNPSAEIVSYSTKQPAKLRADKVSFNWKGMEFRVREGRSIITLTTKLIGEYNVLNILAAAGAARGIGISWEAIKEGVKRFSGITGRMERVDEGQNFATFIDFAHTPAALDSVLTLLKKLKTKNSKLIVVFGAAGERDVTKRPLMGEVAARLADFTVLTAEDSRTEDLNRIIDDITRGIRQNAKVWDGVVDWRKDGTWCIRIPERGEAIAFAVQKLARSGDILVICGKGHEKSMAYDHTEYPWSDQEAARIALQGGVKRVR
mgnify:CR=1 FL=1